MASKMYVVKRGKTEFIAIPFAGFGVSFWRGLPPALTSSCVQIGVLIIQMDERRQ